jgi:2-C-methyl-D-erythritol 4-phosphate cytidylyltransferase
MKTIRNIAIVAAAGAGTRFGSELPKQFLPLGNKPMVAHSLELFERSELIDEIILVVPEEYLTYASQAIVDQFNLSKIRKIIAGAKTRQESVLAGLTACPNGIDLVAIHDADRPFLTDALLMEVMTKAAIDGAAILAVPAKESIKLAENGFIIKTMKRDVVWIAQTPQVFRFAEILDAHRRAEAAYNDATDDSELFEQYCGRVAIIRGSYNNIKITTPGDLTLAQAMYKEMK